MTWKMPPMTRKERLTATLQGKAVDRPPVSFYELDGMTQNPDNTNKFNIYNHPSWRALIDLTREKSDRIVRLSPRFIFSPRDPVSRLSSNKNGYNEKGELCQTTMIKTGPHSLVTRTARNKDVDTVWTLEHLLKNTDDFKVWLDLPEQKFGGMVDTLSVHRIEKKLGDSGIICLDMGDPLCVIASLFDMGEYTITALTEQELFHKALEKVSCLILKRTEAIAKALPGRHWRIYGPEFACPPYLPPDLFKEYVVRYDKPIIDIIKKYGGYPRLHLHGNISQVLDDVVSTGCIGIDPIEPPPQGDVLLKDVRKKYGRDLVLFGNLELSDIETMIPREFEKKVRAALEEGMSGSGRGFVLMPSASPIGRELRYETYLNYRTMIEIAEEYSY